MKTVPRRLGPSGLAFPLCLGATRLGTPVSIAFSANLLHAAPIFRVLLDLRGTSHAPRNDSDDAECRGVYITDSVYRLSLFPVPLGPLALLERFDLSTFLKTVHCDLMHSFTIDTTRRPLPCITYLPMGNSRKPEKVGCLVRVFR